LVVDGGRRRSPLLAAACVRRVGEGGREGGREGGEVEIVF